MGTAEQRPRASALEGLAVVEFGSIAAAYAAKLLADFGADVVTLEPEGGDPLRQEPPHVPDEDGAGSGAMFRYLRTNRRALQLPLDAPTLDRLMAQAKVFITDQPAERRASFGLATDDLRHRFEHLIVASISPFGSVGPAARARGGELVTYGASGLAQATPGLPDSVDDPYEEPPLHPGGYPASITSGLCAAVAILSGLPYDAPAEEAPGDHIDVSQQAAVASIVSRYLAVTAYGAGDVGRSDPGPLNAPNVYVPCRDGYVVIAAVLDAQWERLVQALGEPEWAVDPELLTAAGRRNRASDLEAHLRKWCLARSGDEIVAIAAEHGVPCFRFYRLDEMASSPQVVQRQSVIDAPGTRGAQMPGPPVKLTGSPWRLERSAPSRPTPVDEVLEEWQRSSPANGRRRRDLPLEGIRVLDFGQVLAVPFATQWMAWLGADVLLIESAQHLHTRGSPPFASSDQDPNTSALFNSFNSAKRSLTVDIKSTEGQRILRELVPFCDVVVENFRAGVLDRVGLSAEEVRRLRPDIIHLALGAFGRSGPMRNAAGLHSAANLFSGLADVTRYPGGGPRIMGAVMPDPLSGINSLLAILLALRYRQRTGHGQFIDQAMYEALLPLCAGALMADDGTRIQMRQCGSQGNAAWLSGFFPGRESGTWIALQIDDGHDWEALCRLLGVAIPLGVGPPTTKTRQLVEATLTVWLSTREVAEAVDLLRGAGLPAAPASRTSDVLADEQLRSFGFIRAIDHPIVGPKWVPTLPWRMHAIDELPYRPAPLLGQHVDEILTGLLGHDPEQVESLREQGVLR